VLDIKMVMSWLGPRGNAWHGAGVMPAKVPYSLRSRQGVRAEACCSPRCATHCPAGRTRLRLLAYILVDVLVVFQYSSTMAFVASPRYAKYRNAAEGKIGSRANVRMLRPISPIGARSEALRR
jgi:hypothetical protein